MNRKIENSASSKNKFRKLFPLPENARVKKYKEVSTCSMECFMREMFILNFWEFYFSWWGIFNFSIFFSRKEGFLSMFFFGGFRLLYGGRIWEGKICIKFPQLFTRDGDFLLSFSIILWFVIIFYSRRNLFPPFVASLWRAYIIF